MVLRSKDLNVMITMGETIGHHPIRVVQVHVMRRVGSLRIMETTYYL